MPDTKPDNDILNYNLLFQKELQNILSLIVKEKSTDNISYEILNRCVELTQGSYGLILTNDDNEKHKFIYYDPQQIISNKAEIEKGLFSNYSYLHKRFDVNKNSYVTGVHSQDIGINFSIIMKSDFVMLTPCYFENNLLAVIIIVKDQPFSQIEINIVEQFALIVSFSISNLRTMQLNTALESRLLQTQKLETIGKLSSGMAHDFSNLLSSIFGSLDLLKKRVPRDANILRLLDNIENCSIRAKDLTKGLLSYGKPTPKHKEIVKINALLGEMCKVITQTFPKRIEFKTEIMPDLYEVMGNPTEIYQVLLNLCVNAKEAMDSNGELVLKAENLDSTELDINHPMLSSGNYVHISVKDSGSGIAEENIQKIFDPYFSTKVKETGSGLGLYVSYGIIKAHKGIIEVSSAVNKGTTFDVFLPAFEQKKSEKVPVTEKIIMLVDDELMLRDLLAELLESNSYNVIKVSNGEEALQVLTEELKVDLIIIDYNMPVMNGLECVAKMRDLKLDIPVILSSGSINFDAKDRIDSLGIRHVITKPYEFETMLGIIKESL